MREEVTIANLDHDFDYTFRKDDVKALCNLLVDVLYEFDDEEFISECVANVMYAEKFYGDDGYAMFLDYNKIVDKGDDE